jgi:alanine racemase
MFRPTLLALAIASLFAGQLVPAAPYLPQAGDHRNGQPNRAANAWLEIDLSAFSHNLETLKTKLGPNGPKICAIMKADAYGHGIDLLVPAAVAASIPCLGIASNEEARVAREKGFKGQLMRVRTATAEEMEDALPYTWKR